MIIYPAIDLKNGKCVRLKQGMKDQVTVFDDFPYKRAAEFYESGCKWLHVVDLDGAFEGKSVNGKAVEDIIKNTNMSIQLGGGIRSLSSIEKWLDKGISRVILGTVAVENPEIVKEACKLFPGKIAVGIDAREGKVAVKGWVDNTETEVLDLALRFTDAGVSAIIYTDINRDGILNGPDIKGTSELAQKISIPVILSGGVSSINDLRFIKETNIAFNGVIIGRAIYDKKIDLRQAVEEVSI